MELLDLLYRAGLYAGVAAAVVLAALIPMYIQQSRDLLRLRAWAALTPDRGTAEFQAAESAGRPAPVHAAAVATPATVAPTPGTQTAPIPIVSPAQRVARELPAATRATAERPAVVIHEPWWRGFVRRPKPGYLVAMVIAVLALGVGVGVLTIQLREGPGTEPPSTATSGVNPADVDVAVLNGTGVPGLAAKVGDDLASGGFKIGAIANTGPNEAKTSVVLYDRGHEQEAEAVAHQLGIEQTDVIDSETAGIVDEQSSAIDMAAAPVVVIAGADRAGL